MIGIVALVFCLPVPARGGAGEIARYENKWIVIVGSTRDLKEAWRMKESGDYAAEILVSSYYSKLEPGWFVVVTGSHKSRRGARAAFLKLKNKLIAGYVKFTGPLFDFAGKKYRIEEVAAGPDRLYLRSAGFVHKQEDSPDGQMSVSIRGRDPTSSVLLVRRYEEDEAFVDRLFFQAEEVFWSQDSKRVAFGDDDFYAGSGNLGFLIVDVEKKTFVKIETTKMSPGKKHGQRDMFKLPEVCWLPPGDRVMFSLSVDFMGSSGHPGIDEERRDRLGDDFGKKDPVDLGTFVVYLEPNRVDLQTRPAGLKVYAQDKFGYIDKTGKMVIKPRFDAAGPFEGGLATIEIGGKQMTIDTQGRPSRRRRQPVASQPAAPSAGAPRPIKIGDRYGYRDKTGMIVIDPLFDEAGEFISGLARMKVDGKLGCIDTQGRVVVEPQWDQLHYFRDDLALVRSGNKYGYVDRSGRVVIEPRYESAGNFSEGFAPVKLGSAANP
jgi:hypothetical protein